MSDIKGRYRTEDTRLTYADRQAMFFQRAPLGRRGYDESHVDAVFGLVDQEITRLLNEKTQLTEEVLRLRRQVHCAASDVPPTLRPEDGHIQALQILSTAQRIADQYVANAEIYTRQMAREARHHCDQIVADAQRRAVFILEKAHQRAEQAALTAVSGNAFGDQPPDSAARDRQSPYQ